MAAQLKINATSPVSLKQMSGTDYDYTTYQILNTFAASDTGVGTVSVNPASTTGLTSVGTFTDTYYNVGAPGTHPVGTTVTSTTYTFYQDLQSASEASLVRPLEYSSGIKEQIDGSLNADAITVATANLIANGQGSYALTPSSPTGGTWVAKATISNFRYTGTSDVTYLWRKTAPATVPAALRPLKINATSPVSVKEMSDAEIQTLTACFRNQIVSTGIGKYAVQSTAPVSGGTWVTQGAAFSDTRNTISAIGYTGAYSGGYTGAYSGTYTTTFTGSYTGSFTGSYSGAYAGSYRTSYVGFAGPLYTGYYTGFYSGTYSRAFVGGYVGSFTGSYSGTYTGSYSGTYTGNTLDATTTTISTVSLWMRTA